MLLETFAEMERGGVNVEVAAAEPAASGAKPAAKPAG
jgi:hypothetical protein